MVVQFGNLADITSWMKLVKEVKQNFPGLETEEAFEEHKKTVMKFISQKCSLCVKEQGEVVGVLLFSRKYNMICCLAVNPEFRNRGIASMLIKKLLMNLTVTKILLFLPSEKEMIKEPQLGRFTKSLDLLKAN